MGRKGHLESGVSLLAKPGELAAAIAELFGAEPPTVRQQARELRDAGLMAKEKGGRGAGSMSTRDAAHLLLAAAATSSVRECPRFIARPGAFVARQGRWKLDFAPIPQLRGLDGRHSFADALEALLIAGSDGTLEKVADQLEGRDVDLIRDLISDLQVIVEIAGPIPRASIKICAMSRDSEGVPIELPKLTEHHHYDRTASTGKGNLSGIVIATAGEMDLDLTRQHTFTHRTIMSIAHLLRS